MQVTPMQRVMPVSSTQQSITVQSRKSSNSTTIIDPNLRSLPKLTTYDIFEKKSPQQLLYESAQERHDPEDKWNKFNYELENRMGYKKYSKHLVKTLDNTNQWAALHYAVFNNNTFVCNKLTDKNSPDKHLLCDINIVTGNGENVLHIAARSNILWPTPSLPIDSMYDIREIDGEMVSLPNIITTLIARGVDVNHADDEGRTPLHLAVMNNHLSFVKYLLSEKANLYATTKLHCHVLHLTFIPSGQNPEELSSMVQYLLGKLKSNKSTSNFPWINERKNFAQMCTLDNQTPLVFAVCHPAITKETLKALLDENFSINILIDQPVLELSTGHIQNLMAIEQVARRRLSNFEHLLPLLDSCDHKIRNQLFHFPCRYNNLNLLKWLINPFSSDNNPEKLRTSANKNFNLNERDHAGYTPLLTAVFYKSTKCVQYLLQNASTSAQTSGKTHSMFVNIEATNNDGENILHICVKHSIPKDLFQIVWDSTVHTELPKKPDANGNLPLHVAAGNNQIDMCEALLTVSQSSIDLLHVKNNHGQTAAHVAIEAEPHRIGPDQHHVDKNEKDKQKNHEVDNVKDDKKDFGLPILELMWKHTSKDSRDIGLFEQNSNRQTCLHLAAAKGQQKIVEFLVETVGLEVDAIADRRLTPLHLACQNGQEDIVAYLIEHGASPTFRNAELHNSLEIAIMNQYENVVKELLTLPNWRELISNAQPIHNSEAYDTPMRKLIRYMPNVAIWMIEEKLTQTVGGQGRHVFKKVYDYEFYMDVYRIKQWYAQGVQLSDEEESFAERCHRRGCTALCYSNCCHQRNLSEEESNEVPYTDDAYTLVRNHPLIIASEQSQCPDLVEHPYNIFLRARWFEKNGFYIVRFFSFLLYAAFLALWTAIILLGKNPQYFYNKARENMTLDLDLCANVSRVLTAANDSEALKTAVYRRLKYSLYAFLLFFVIENIILIIALFPRVFRTIDYILEVSAFVLTFVYIYDWYDWQEPVSFRCPVQYQIGAMGLLLAWMSMLSYVKRSTWFNMGVFVAMIQLIGFKFMRFIPVLLVVVCGFGFTHWMLLQNQAPFQNPVEAVIRAGILMFELNYEDHLYKDTYYYDIIFVVTILSSIVFCIFILNLLISVAVGEMPSLTIQGQMWQSQMLYDLLSDYSIVFIQIMRFINCLTCGCIHRWLFRKHLHPIVVLEHDQKGSWFENAEKYIKRNFFDEKIQDDIIPSKTSQDTSKDDK